MNENNRKNAKVAQELGYTEFFETASGELLAVQPSINGNLSRRCVVSDYGKDLNAMNIAEKNVIIKLGIGKSFLKHLYDVINDELVAHIGYQLDDLISSEEVFSYAVHASAEQRREAFIRTIGQITKDIV